MVGFGSWLPATARPIQKTFRFGSGQAVRDLLLRTGLAREDRDHLAFFVKDRSAALAVGQRRLDEKYRWIRTVACLAQVSPSGLPQPGGGVDPQQFEPSRVRQDVQRITGFDRPTKYECRAAVGYYVQF